MLKEYSLDTINLKDSEEFTVMITEEMMKKFLEISGDINPLHVDKEFATSKGFEDRVVYGMLISSFYSKLVGVYIPGKFCLLQGIDIKFIKPVFVGDELKIVGTVDYISHAAKQIEIKAVIFNNSGKKLSSAKIKVGINE